MEDEEDDHDDGSSLPLPREMDNLIPLNKLQYEPSSSSLTTHDAAKELLHLLH